MRLSLGMSSNSCIYLINNNYYYLMELEKTLFRVHERVLTGKYISNILLFLIVTFMTISANFLIFFVILNAS